MRFYSRFEIDNACIWAEYIKGDYYQVIGSIHDTNPPVASVAIDMKHVVLLTPYFGQKVIALAYNYKSLVEKNSDFDEPLVFFKSPEGVIPDGGNIVYPDFADNVWIEAELTIVVGKMAKNISVEDANEYILGYTCGNDVTAENILKRDWHLARAKGLDTFCPVGPYLVKDVDTHDLRIQSFINEKKTQDSRTSDRVLNDQESLALASKYFTLHPGDIILTGTPGGATDAIIQKGDEVKIIIEHVGTLTNGVN